MLKVCFLQGPFSPLFKSLAKELEQQGNEVQQIVFCSGDELFSHNNKVRYKGSRLEWEHWFEAYLNQHKPDAILGLGDCHHYHFVANKVAKKLGIKTFFLEEGYIRPCYITLEEGGVNAFSSLCAKPWAQQSVPFSTTASEQISAPFWVRAMWCMTYYLANTVGRRRFPHYVHRRRASITEEAQCWIKAGYRKLKYKITRRGRLQSLLSGKHDSFFLVPLQVGCDSQVVVHSDFESMELFIEHVVHSFKNHASKSDAIAFKHHPMCRGFTDYESKISELAEAYNLKGRLYYLHDENLPFLLGKAKGVVTINSTVGISSLHHSRPLKTLGRCFFNQDGLASQQSLEDFWKNPAAPDKEQYKSMIQHLKQHSLVNASLYSDFTFSARQVAKKLISCM